MATSNINPAVYSASSNTRQNLATVAYTTTIPAVAISNVAIVSNAGAFTSDAFQSYKIGDTITLTGAFANTATGNIAGYTSPATYYVTKTDGTTQFTLSASATGNITTTAGTTSGVVFRSNSTAVEFPAQTGVPYYVEGARTQYVQLPTVSANIGTAVTAVANTANSQFSLASGNITYQLTGAVVMADGTPFDLRSPATVKWVNVTAGNTVIGSALIGQPVTCAVTTGNANVVVALAVTQGGNKAAWNYPAGIISASATITEVSGYQGT
jgi:hypothetical protein